MSEEITAESFFGPEKPELTAKIPKEVVSSVLMW